MKKVISLFKNKEITFSSCCYGRGLPNMPGKILGSPGINGGGKPGYCPPGRGG